MRVWCLNETSELQKVIVDVKDEADIFIPV